MKYGLERLGQRSCQIVGWVEARSIVSIQLVIILSPDSRSLSISASSSSAARWVLVWQGTLARVVGFRFVSDISYRTHSHSCCLFVLFCRR